MNRPNIEGSDEQNLDERTDVNIHNINKNYESGDVPNFGYKPLQDENVNRSVNSNQEGGQSNTNVKRKRDIKEEIECEIWSEKINRLICKYPGLELRTSSEMMEILSQFNLKELKNIHTNCINDTMELRGTPTSEFTISALTYHINKNYVKGYTSKCLNDVELKREIEEEIIEIFGMLSNKFTILFRMVNNLYQCVFQSDFIPDKSIDSLFNKGKQFDAEEIHSKYIYPIERREQEEEDENGVNQEKEDEPHFPPHPDDVQRGNKRRKTIGATLRS